jgi:hypothetical protein
MKEENIETDEINIADKTFWDEVTWDKVAFNQIDKLTFLRTLSINKKLYATFLGNQEQLQFYMYKPLSWPVFKEIKTKNLSKEETHQKIIMECVVWPRMDVLEFNSLDAGVVLTLVYQILAISNFLKNPDKALEMILELK